MKKNNYYAVFTVTTLRAELWGIQKEEKTGLVRMVTLLSKHIII